MKLRKTSKKKSAGLSVVVGEADSIFIRGVPVAHVGDGNAHWVDHQNGKALHLRRNGHSYMSQVIPYGKRPHALKLSPAPTAARSPNPHSGDKAERRAWEKKLHAGPKMYPCPTCVARGVREPSMLSAKQKALGHQCNACADRDEGRYGNPVKRAAGVKSITCKHCQRRGYVLSEDKSGLCPSCDAQSPRTVLRGYKYVGSPEMMDRAIEERFGGRKANPKTPRRKNPARLHPSDPGYIMITPYRLGNEKIGIMTITDGMGNLSYTEVKVYSSGAVSTVKPSQRYRTFQEARRAVDAVYARRENPASQIKIPKQSKYFHITTVAKPKTKRLPNPTMTGVEFRDRLLSLAKVGDRTLLVKATEKTVAEGSIMSLRSTDSVYVNFINLPKGFGDLGGGAEAQNNRWMFSVKGFDRGETVKVEEVMSPVRKPKLRAKTGSPEKIAKYLADYLAEVVATVPPNFTHSRSPNPSSKKVLRANPAKQKIDGSPIVRRIGAGGEFYQTADGRWYVHNQQRGFVRVSTTSRSLVHSLKDDTKRRLQSKKLEQLRVLPIDHSASPRQPVALAEFVSGHLSRLERPLVGSRRQNVFTANLLWPARSHRPRRVQACDH